MSAQSTLITCSPQELAELVLAKVEERLARPVWVNADELAQRLRISQRQVEELAHYGKIPYFDCATPGSKKKKLRFSVRAVERAMGGGN